MNKFDLDKMRQPSRFEPPTRPTEADQMIREILASIERRTTEAGTRPPPVLVEPQRG